MRKSKIRSDNVTKNVVDKYYEVIFYTILEKTYINSIEILKNLERWAEFAGADYELLKRAYLKLSIGSYGRSKMCVMKSLAYFGVTVVDMKEVFGLTPNYVKGMRTSNYFPMCNSEEIQEIRKTIDNLLYLLGYFKYLEFEEGNIVLQDVLESNIPRACELYFRTVLFHFNKRYKKLFTESVDKPIAKLSKFTGSNCSELEYINNKLHRFCMMNSGEIKRLLYFAFRFNYEDTKELLEYTKVNMFYLNSKYKERTYYAILREDERDILMKFLRSIYKDTKYLLYLKKEEVVLSER